MSQNAQRLAKVVHKKLAAARLERISQTSATGWPSRMQVAAFIFNDLQVLLNIERAQTGGSHPEIFLHSLLRRISPVYAKVFEIGEHLEIEFQPRFLNPIRLLEEFDPFSEKVTVPALKEDLEWLLGRKIDQNTIAAFQTLTDFNFSAFHEMSHAVLMRLIANPDFRTADTKQIFSFFLFVESLVGILETTLADELGSYIGNSLRQAKSIYRSARDGAPPLIREPSCLELASNLMTHLAYMNGYSKRDMKRILPSWAPFDSRSTVGYRSEFTNDTTQSWFAKRAFFGRKPFAKNAALAMPRLELQTLGFQDLLKERKLVEEVSTWYKDLLF